MIQTSAKRAFGPLPGNEMKKAFLLCAAISAALILGGCANQNSSATGSGLAQQGAVNSGTGGGGGGLGGVPGRNPIRTLP